MEIILITFFNGEMYHTEESMKNGFVSLNNNKFEHLPGKEIKL